MTTSPESDAIKQHGPEDGPPGQAVPGQGAAALSPPLGPRPKVQQAARRSGLLDRPRPLLGGKSVWDWFSFLLNLFIPLVIGTIGWGLWLAHQQQQSDQQHTLEQQQSDQQHALDAILQTYINNMQNLLVNNNLGTSKPGDEISLVAREQTLTTLRRLDAGRNSTVFRFLQEAHLTGTQEPVIDLSNADLRGDHLDGADLSSVDLNGATLTGAHLHGADLSNATLYGANLGGTDLSAANLSGAYLFDATLTGADLNGANMSNATLTGAFLGGTRLNHAMLTGVHMSGAILAGAHLNDASLSGASLYGADLHNADLRGANFGYADLNAQSLTHSQLDKVYSCTNAILPAGFICRHTVRVNLRYWYTESPAEVPVIFRLIRKFERLNPGITVTPVLSPFFQTETGFITAVQAGRAPDVLRSDVGWVTQFASRGYLLNLDSYISQGDLSDYRNAPLGNASLQYDYYNGNLYGLPQVSDFLALLYNKAELKEVGITHPPATMAELETDAEDIVRGKAARFGFETNGTSYDVLPFLYAYGGGMFDHRNNILVSSRGSVSGLEFLLKLQDNDKVMPTNVNFADGSIDMVSDFAHGKTAMIFDGPWDISKILTSSGSVFTGKRGDLGIARIPIGPAGRSGSPLGGQSDVIYAGTAHPFEAYKFISFMNSTASQIAIAKSNHTLPTRRSAYQNEGFSDPFITEFLSMTDIAVARPPIPQGGHLFDAFDPGIVAALDGIESPAEALNAVAEAWKQLRAGS